MPTLTLATSCARRRRRAACRCVLWRPSVAAATAATCLRPPVDAPISRPFDAPPCPWCAGHRGITYAVAAGHARCAPRPPETVTFSGVVVDVRYVVVRHGDGLLATYGGLASTALQHGDAVVAGRLVGRSGGELYFGLRTGPDTYIDPLAAARGAGRAALPRAHRRDRRVARRQSRCCAAARYDRPSAHRPVGRSSLNRPPHCGRLLAPVGGTTAEGEPRWLSSRCASCSKLASTSVTRPAGGTRRCAASSSASATASTSSIWSRRCRGSRRPTASSATSSPAAAC